jgi:uncharacterized membrane protein YphA (DoxX/SURF4 family)
MVRLAVLGAFPTMAAYVLGFTSTGRALLVKRYWKVVGPASGEAAIREAD